MLMGNLVRLAVALLMPVLLLSACGGGATTSSTVPPRKMVNGVAMAGVFSKGTAVFKGYSGAASSKEYTLTFANFSGTQGAFSANIGSYNGPLKINVSGNYVDEVTNRSVTVAANNPLKATIAQSSLVDGMTVTVTPLTDVAANKAIAAGLSNATINQNNQGVAQLFGLTDVTTTIPAVPTLANISSLVASPENTYAVALVQMSNYVAQYATITSGATIPSVTGVTLQGALSAALAQFSGGITVTGGSTTSVAITAPELSSAMNTILQSSSNYSVNNTMVALSSAAVSTISAAQISAASALNIRNYPLSLVGSSAVPVYEITLQFTLPENITITADQDGVVAVGAVTPLAGGCYIKGTLRNSVLTLNIISGTGIVPTATGVPFATIMATVNGASNSLKPDNATFWNGDGNRFLGPSVTVGSL